MNQQPLGTLEEQVERYKQVLDVMPAGVILLDTQGVVHEANPEAQRLLEMPLVGQKWFEVIQQAFSPREDDGHEISLRNGRKVRLAISASTTGQLILITDLTETRLLQSRISDLQRLSSLGRMVASLAHQVRTPLSSAMLYASNLGAPNLPPVTKEHDVWVQLLGAPPSQNEAIKMEVGIEDCLHIEFEYSRRVYHLQDVILGKIHFLLVRIKIKHMELAVLRRETSGEGVAAASGSKPGGANAAAAAAPPDSGSASIFTETQTLVKYEIMDGAPVKGEVIPVKLSLRGIPADLTPTYAAINNRFSVRYFLNLVLVDEEDRRYFKQQEIILWRKELG